MAESSALLVAITLLASIALILAPVSAFLPAISTITTPLLIISAISASIISVTITTTLVFLVVVVARIVLCLTLDLLAVVEVFALGLDEAVRFDTGETGENFFGQCVALWFAWCGG